MIKRILKKQILLVLLIVSGCTNNPYSQNYALDPNSVLNAITATAIYNSASIPSHSHMNNFNNFNSPHSSIGMDKVKSSTTTHKKSSSTTDSNSHYFGESQTNFNNNGMTAIGSSSSYTETTTRSTEHIKKKTKSTGFSIGGF